MTKVYVTNQFTRNDLHILHTDCALVLQVGRMKKEEPVGSKYVLNKERKALDAPGTRTK